MKYKVFYNDEVNEMAEVLSANTLNDCKIWIENALIGLVPVDEEHPCTDDVMNSSKTFCYEVYDRPVVEIIDDEEVFNEPVFSTDYYYSK